MSEIKEPPSKPVQAALAVRLANSIPLTEGQAFQLWAHQLLAIRQEQLPALLKAKRALEVTRQHAVLVPVLKMIAREVKRNAWDDRGTVGRFGIAGAAVSFALFGGQGAGIAAFGTAIGVPLWVVIGSGAAFAGCFVEEFARRSAATPQTETDKFHGVTIEADKESS